MLKVKLIDRKPKDSSWVSITYGLGSAHLSESLGVDINEAKKILTDFFSTYRNIKDWKEFNTQKMETYGFMETILGRRRRLPDVFLNPVEVKAYDIIHVDNIFPQVQNDFIKVLNKEQSDIETKNLSELRFKKKESQKELLKSIGYDVIDNGAFLSRTNTQCTNSVIQGSAADMTKMAMIAIHENELLKKCKAKLRFLVHDEILIECPVQYREEVEKEFVNCMTSVAKGICKVNMICDAELETRWKEGHTIGKIKDYYKENGEEAVYNKYREFNKEDLKRIIEDKFNPEVEVLRVR